MLDLNKDNIDDFLQLHDWRVAKFAQLSAWNKAKFAFILSWDWAKFAGRVVGAFRTFFFFGIAGLLGIGEMFSMVDLSSLLYMFLPEGGKITVGGVLAILSICGIVLRAVTSTPAFQKWREMRAPLPPVAAVPPAGDKPVVVNTEKVAEAIRQSETEES